MGTGTVANLVLLVVVVVLSPCSGLDVSDMCTRCSCQYLLSSQHTDTVCTIDKPVLEVNCTVKPKVTQNANHIPNAPATSNSTTIVWLSYQYAGLTSLHPFTHFEPFNVTHLALDYNRLVYIPPRAMTGLQNLGTLSASHNDINSVAPDAFKGLRHLRHVDLSFNSLHTLDFTLFLDAVSLLSFNVRNNNIKTLIPTNKKMESLKELDVSSNKIPDYPLLFFSSFPNLSALNISFNNLGTFSADLFPDLFKLQILDLSGNFVERLNEKAVENLKSLTKLYLSENLISDISFVRVLSNLITLHVSKNNLTNLGHKPLSSTLQGLLISHNNLRDLSHVFLVFPNLKSLDASWNPCPIFPENVRAGLRELVLDGTLIRSWPAQRPGEGKIDYLSLSHNPGITALGPYAFSGIIKHKNESGKCATLKISNTSLNTVDEDALKDLDICRLDLSHNQLHWLPEGLLPWESLVGVDLQQNPWHCDCALQWVVTSLIPTIYKNDQSLLDDFRCTTPEELAKIRLVHWLYHSNPGLCGASRSDAMLTFKSRNPGHPFLVTLSSSPLMIAVLLALSFLAAFLVILAFALQRRAVKMRKMRRNRRF